MKAPVDDAALAESRAFNEDLRLRLAQMPPVHTLPPEVVRQGRRDGKSVFPPLEFVPQARDMTIPTRNGEIRLRVLAPEGEAAGVYREPSEQYLLGLAKQLMAPIQRRPQGPVTRVSDPLAARKNIERVPEPVRDLIGREYPNTRCGKLYGERYALQLRTHLRHCLSILGCKFEARVPP